MQGPIQGTAYRITTVHFLDDAANVLREYEPMVDENAPNHQDALLGFDLAPHVAAECPSACLDIPRCQRGGKCAL